MTVSRAAGFGQTATSRWGVALWWSAVITTFLAIAGFLCALTPRRRRGRHFAPAGPGYFEDIGRGAEREPPSRAFERIAHDPTGPLLASLQRTSEIIRAKYRWIEIGIVLVLVALPQLAAVLRMSV
ncbi:Pycsar system effector family protein [Streptomyces sp. NPDC048483]|uniref:Pycsar system effector family protein n=1 Tax=Streptomyces sp. NPDC048483 TaxID=3154927 RepID=UPI0034415BBF